MKRPGLHRTIPLLATLGLLAGAPSAAWACSVCTGNPASAMAQGARMGVLVLVAFIGSVLVGIVTVTGCWMVRARRLARGPHEPPARS